MKRNVRETNVKARALTDPQPRFTSMVKGGANQRPFRAVKMDNATPVADNTTEKDDTMSKKSIVSDGFDVAALKFDKADFPTEDVVKAWLEKGGYSEYTIKSTDAGFEIDNTAVVFTEGTIEKVAGAAKGVTAYVGQVSTEAPVEKSADEAIADKAAANTSAVQPVATKSEAAPAADVVEPVAADPAVAVEVVEATLDDVAKQIADVEITIKGMYETSVLSSVLQSLKWLVEDADYEGTDDAIVEATKTAARSLIGALSISMSDAVAKFETAFRAIAHENGLTLKSDAVAPVAVEENAPAAVEPAVEPVVTDATKSAAATEGTTDTPAPASDPLIDAIKALTSAVSGMKSDIQAVSDKVEQTEAAMKSRVEAVEQTSQSRKGADVTAPGDVAPTTEEAQKMSDERIQSRRRFASAMGHPDPSRM